MIALTSSFSALCSCLWKHLLCFLRPRVRCVCRPVCIATVCVPVPSCWHVYLFFDRAAGKMSDSCRKAMSIMNHVYSLALRLILSRWVHHR
jgi:hypothetical protein